MVRFQDALKLVQGGFACKVHNKTRFFASKEDFVSSAPNENYIVSAIFLENNQLTFELQLWEPPIATVEGEWAENYNRQNGSDPGFF